jgi:beta-mannosidase
MVSIAEHQPSEFQDHNTRFQKLFLDVLLHAVYDNSKSISYSFSSTTNGYISLNHSAAMPMVPRLNYTENGTFANTGKFGNPIL